MLDSDPRGPFTVPAAAGAYENPSDDAQMNTTHVLVSLSGLVHLTGCVSVVRAWNCEACARVFGTDAVVPVYFAAATSPFVHQLQEMRLI